MLVYEKNSLTTQSVSGRFVDLLCLRIATWKIFLLGGFWTDSVTKQQSN